MATFFRRRGRRNGAFSAVAFPLQPFISMEFALETCKQLCTSIEYAWVKLARSGRLSELPDRELDTAVREVRELRKKYRDLHERQRGRRKRGGRGESIWEISSGIPSRTEQKQMIFANALELLQREQALRERESSMPADDAGEGFLRRGVGPEIGRIRFRETDDGTPSRP